MDVVVEVSVDSGWVTDDDDVVDVPAESIGLLEDEPSVSVALGPAKNLAIRMVRKIRQTMCVYICAHFTYHPFAVHIGCKVK